MDDRLDEVFVIDSDGNRAIMRSLFLPDFLGGLGNNTTLQAGIRITTPKKLSIGSNCNIAQCVFLLPQEEFESAIG